MRLKFKLEHAMIKLWISLFALLIAGWTSMAAAQEVWTYATIGADNNSTITFTAPVDLTYPPAGQPIPMIGPNEDPAARGVRLTPQQAASRLAAPRVIIMLVPLQQATNISTMPIK